LFYVYDSYKIAPEEWSKLLSENGEKTVRNTELDALYIGLWVEEKDSAFFNTSGFDGFYTYFASEGFVFGSTILIGNIWLSMQKIIILFLFHVLGRGIPILESDRGMMLILKAGKMVNIMKGCLMRPLK
jgi:hypothetical protein